MIDDEEEVIEALKNVKYLKEINDELYSIHSILVEIADTLAIGLLGRKKNENS
jgi:hypothetical protein